MTGADWRQQEELEQEREDRTLEVLDRVDQGLATHDDVEFLAAELGVTKQFQQETRCPKHTK